jgi:SAM-dependent methyltransferase
MDDLGQTPRARLETIAHGFIEAKILLTAAELRLFDALRPPGATAPVVGGELRGVEILLDALVAMEIVAKEGERYRNRAEYEPHLLEEARDCYPARLRHSNHLFRGWARLEERITGRREAAGGERSVVSEPATNRNFIQAMYAVGAAGAPAVVDRIDLSGVASVVDLGGGPGHYLREIGHRLPAATLYLVDLPLTLETARDLLRHQGDGGRVQRVAWDFYHAPPPPVLPPVDLIFFSQVIHAETPEHNRALLRALYPLVAPGGRLIVHENVVDPGRTTPKEAALFAVNMLAMTPGGRTYTEQEIAAWGEAAGFLCEGGERIHARSYLLTLRRPPKP